MLHLVLTPLEILYEICCSMSADMSVIFEVWKNILSVCNILVQTRFTVLRGTSVSILHLLRFGGWWWCAYMRLWVAPCFQCFVGHPLSSLYPTTLCQTPRWLASPQYPPCSAQMSPHTHPDTPHTLQPPEEDNLHGYTSVSAAMEMRHLRGSPFSPTVCEWSVLCNMMQAGNNTYCNICSGIEDTGQ